VSPAFLYFYLFVFFSPCAIFVERGIILEEIAYKITIYSDFVFGCVFLK
jgi:hypothetical protein